MVSPPSTKWNEEVEEWIGPEVVPMRHVPNALLAPSSVDASAVALTNSRAGALSVIWTVEQMTKSSVSGSHPPLEPYRPSPPG